MAGVPLRTINLPVDHQIFGNCEVDRIIRFGFFSCNFLSRDDVDGSAFSYDDFILRALIGIATTDNDAITTIVSRLCLTGRNILERLLLKGF